MKKLALTALALLTAGSALAADGDGKGTVEIRGKVVDQTCTVDTKYKNLVVILPTVSKADLAAKGQTAGKKDFEIKVENCTAASSGASSSTTIYAAFSPIAASHVDNDNKGTLFNRVSGTTASFTKAANVNVQLLDKDGKEIDLSGTTIGGTAATGTGSVSATHPLSAQGNKFYYDANEDFVKTGKKIDANQHSTDVLGKKVVGGESVFGDTAKSGAGETLGSSKEYTLKYAAQYYATGVAGAGEVEAFVTYNIAYK